MRRVNPLSAPFPLDPGHFRKQTSPPTIILILLWVLVNIASELLEELTELLEPIFALLQWAVLQMYFRRVHSWILASLAGWLIVVVAFFLSGFANDLNDWLVNEGVIGLLPSPITIGAASINTQVLVVKTLLRCLEWLLIGGCQWVVWQQTQRRRAVWWILMSAIAGALRGATGVISEQLWGKVAALLIAPLVYSILTGMVLLLFLQSPRRRRSHEEDWLSEALDQ